MRGKRIGQSDGRAYDRAVIARAHAQDGQTPSLSFPGMAPAIRRRIVEGFVEEMPKEWAVTYDVLGQVMVRQVRPK
jgi:hypothetical protein